FTTTPASNITHLVETDPRFANYRQWQSSDYLLDALGRDPALTQKRLGDGFYEQQLIRDQVGQLTGRRLLDGFTNDQDEYIALMNAGATYAKSWSLVPGIALSAAQMAQLTSDIVWLVEQTVTLPDGSTQRVLVPQVYVRVKSGDLDGSGALLAGQSLELNLTGQLDNTNGKIGSRTVTAITAESIKNLGGRMTGTDLAAHTRGDLDNNGGTIDAVRSINATAEGNILLQSTTKTASNATSSRTTIDRVAGLYITGTDPGGSLYAHSEGQTLMKGAVISNASAGGDTLVTSKAGTELGSLVTEQTDRYASDARNRSTRSATTEIGTQFISAGNVDVLSDGDIHGRAVQVDADGAVRIKGKGNVTLDSGVDTVSVDAWSESKSRGFATKKTITTEDHISAATHVASTIGGKTVEVRGEGVTTVRGAEIVSDEGTSVTAGKELRLLDAVDTYSEQRSRTDSKTGLFSNGGLSATLGNQTQGTTRSVTRTTSAGSTIGAIHGDASAISDGTLVQQGSTVAAPNGTATVAGKKLEFLEGHDTETAETTQTRRQSGLSLQISSTVTDALQSAAATGAATRQTGNERMKLLGAASTAASMSTAASSMQGMASSGSAQGAAQNANIQARITIGGSESKSTTTVTTDAAHKSLVSGKNVVVMATGDGANSTIDLRGTDIKASEHATVWADGAITLSAAQNTTEQQTRDKSIAGGAGIGISYSKDGWAAGFTASASGALGKADGRTTEQVNSHITGDLVTIHSGGPLTLNGAVIAGNRVEGDVHGPLVIKSLQDTATFDSQQASVSGSVTIGYGFSGSASASASKAKGDFASVKEQSGIKAGDGGFDLHVDGKTTLDGAAITSTQAAIDAGKNSFTSVAGVTTTDIQNHDQYSASGVSLAGSTGKETASSDGMRNFAGGSNGMAAGIG
ncbi:MAG: hypothetical protein JWQ11_4882, partial [Rhizobacter sp.]|nr:hypothetical protein [Rhizobacter sp.]